QADHQGLDRTHLCLFPRRMTTIASLPGGEAPALAGRTPTSEPAPKTAPAPAEAAVGRHAILVEEAEAGERIDRLIARRLPALSRSRAKGLIEAGALSAGGATITEASTRVKAGQSYLLTVPEATPALPE